MKATAAFNMRLLQIIVFCAALLGLIAIGLEASHCSPHKKREMIRKVCGNYKRKRGIPSTYEYENKHRFYEENSVSGEYSYFYNILLKLTN